MLTPNPDKALLRNATAKVEKYSKTITVYDLMRLAKWHKLKKKDKRWLKIAFPRRHICRSYKNLGELWGTSRYRAENIIESFLAREYIKKKHRFHKNSDGEDSGIHAANYYAVTKKGEAHTKELLDFLFEGYEKKTYLNALDVRVKNLGIKVLFTTTQGTTYVVKNKPRESADSSIPAFEDRKIVFISRVFAGYVLPDVASDLFFATWRPGSLGGNPHRRSLKKRKLSSKEPDSRDSFKKGRKFRAVKKIFESLGFEDELESAYRGQCLRLMKIPLKQLVDLLKMIRTKLANNWKLRSFWAFFNSELVKLPEKQRFAKPWFPMLAIEHRDAIDGKQNKVMEGVDRAVAVQGMSKLERHTEEKISLKSLERLMRYDAQKIKAAVDAVSYRMSLGKGDLPEERSMEEEPKSPNRRPIYKQVKVNLNTKEPYTEEDRLAGAPSAIINKIVGYEPIKEKPPEQEEPEEKQSKKYKPIKSWTGMLLYAVKLGTPYAINKAFCEKRETTA